ncbi:HBR293Cp [Eremothecium sinecaudum]|uniref:HBR293Cp n=1 Tax=Eremothecium sinecaudum TaxID=45286 RepID=A0A109UX99_9SACH|nr:HBR293Cp [Eremothecium sinecaudum]AMD19194.1 HBR293Cp [Eremothecium sinecaudum]
MSNFFRDKNIGFKQRSNIFSKMRSKELGKDVAKDIVSNLSKDVSKEIDGESTASGIDSNFFHRHEGPSKGSFTSLANTSGVSIIDDLVHESTPKRKKFGAGRLLENEIKAEISDNALEEPGVYKESAHPQVGDTSSNDVLLVAFTNTQRICANLKHELQEQQAKNAQQKQEIDNYKRDIDKIKEKVAGYLTLLDGLGDKSKWLLEQKKCSDKKIEQFKQCYETMSSKLQLLQKHSDDLSAKLRNLRTQQMSRESDIKGRDMEISYLRNELNNCAGQLSEEKIKNNDLIQQLGCIKEDFRTVTNELIEKQGLSSRDSFQDVCNGVEGIKTTVLQDMAQKVEKLESIINTNSSVQIKALQDRSDTILLELAQGFENSNDKVASNLEDYNRNILTKFEAFNGQLAATIQNSNKHMISKFDSGITELIRKWHQNNELQKHTTTIVQDSKQTVVQLLTQSATEFKKQVSETETSVLEEISKLDKQISGFGGQLKMNEKYQETVAGLQEQIHITSLRKSEIVAMMKAKDAEIEVLNNQIYSKNEAIESMKNSCSDIEKQLVAANDAHSKAQSEYARMSEELITYKATTEQKFAAQSEVLKLLKEENDVLKIKLQECETRTATVNDDRKQIQDKFQGLQENLHKLNVEVVQLKAHELELEEDNRRLKDDIQTMESVSKEEDLESLHLKEQVKSMDLERRGFVTERLDYQDKIEILENQLSQLRKQMQVAAENTVTNKRQPPPHKQQIQAAPDVNKTSKPDVSPEGDEFDLSSSLHDELDLTATSPIKTDLSNTRNKNTVVKASAKVRRAVPLTKHGRKKMLISDDDCELVRKLKKKKY